MNSSSLESRMSSTRLRRLRDILLDQREGRLALIEEAVSDTDDDDAGGRLDDDGRILIFERPTAADAVEACTRFSTPPCLLGSILALRDSAFAVLMMGGTACFGSDFAGSNGSTMIPDDFKRKLLY